MDRQRAARLAGTVGSSEENGLAGRRFADGLENPQFVAPGLLQGAVNVFLHRRHFVKV